MLRRDLLRAAVGAASVGVSPQIAVAASEDLAGAQIRMIVPFPAGGPTDIVARPLAQALGDALKATLVVDNRGGAGGALGANAGAKSVADGRTLLMATVRNAGYQPCALQKPALRRCTGFYPDCARRRRSRGHRSQSGTEGE